MQALRCSRPLKALASPGTQSLRGRTSAFLRKDITASFRAQAVGTRGMADAAIEKALPATSNMPSKPTGYPTPALTKEDIAEHLEVLYSRGWVIPRFARRLDSGSIVLLPNLQKMFVSQNFEESIKFAQAIAEVAKKEDHHPTIRIDRAHVWIGTYTHSALRPIFPGQENRTFEQPGLTLRDVRLAFLVDAAASNFGVQPPLEKRSPPAILRPTSLQGITSKRATKAWVAKGSEASHSADA